jgi:O-acetylhomoserine (thiol)-lyase
MKDRQWGFRTRAVHAGARPDPTTGARAVPIYQTTSFVFDDAGDAADLFALQKYGNIYSRISNPTVAAFEERMASLEQGIGAVATASGQAAEFLTVTALAGAGDHLVSSAALYGGTRGLFDVSLRRLGIDTTFVAPDDPSAFAGAIRQNTKLLYTELIGNPSGVVADLSALASIAHDHGVPLVVDSTLATPYLCRPLDHGADIVVHSATKFIGGHGTSIGGVVIESGRFDWTNGRFPTMTEAIPSYNGLRFAENFGEYAFCTKLRVEQLRDFGACLAPFNAFLFLQGLETLPQRMDAHVANAQGLAEHLAGHNDVAEVFYAGLDDSPSHDLARRYLPLGPGAVVSFRLRGGYDAGIRFVESLELLSHLANVGDVRSLVIHPASTTHQRISEEARRAGGVTEDLVRISVGIEDLDDILWDVDQALEQAAEL